MKTKTLKPSIKKTKEQSIPEQLKQLQKRIQKIEHQITETTEQKFIQNHVPTFTTERIQWTTPNPQPDNPTLKQIITITQLNLHPSTKIILIDFLLNPGTEKLELRAKRINVGVRTYYRAINDIRNNNLISEIPSKFSPSIIHRSFNPKLDT